MLQKKYKNTIFIKYDKPNKEWVFSFNKEDILLSLVTTAFNTTAMLQRFMKNNNLSFSEEWYEIDKTSSPDVWTFLLFHYKKPLETT